MRQIIGEAFNPDMVQNQLEPTERITYELIDTLEETRTDEIEFIEDFAFELPVQVISEIMGLPRDVRQNVGEWSKDISLTLFHYYDAENRHQKTERGISKFATYLEELVSKRRAEPQDDLLTYLTEATVGGERLTDDEVVATTVLLLFAGHETTTKLLANGVLELLRHPEQFEMLRSDPSLAQQATEEILRYQGTSKSLTRGVIKDFELHGKQIEAGQRLLLSQAAANRDPRKFDNPDTFDITRGSMDHLGFGHGTHHCLGAPLARLETRIAFPALVQAFPDMELATDEIQWTQSPLVRGPEELHIRLEGDEGNAP
jgi:cytochrome P450